MQGVYHPGNPIRDRHTMRTFFVIIILTLALGAALARALEPLTFVADEWCPYNCTPGDEHEGFVLDIVRRIYGEAGYEVRYKSIPWTRALHEVRQGTYDAAIAATGNEAPGLVYPVEACGESDNAFYTRIGSPWRWTGVQSLASMRTAFIRDYDYGDSFVQFLADNKDSPMVTFSVEDDALARNLRILAHGRLDIVVADVNVGRYTIRAMGLDDVVEFNSQENIPEPVYVAFSPQRKDARRLAELYDEGMDRLRASGELAAILARYGLVDWK